MSFLVTDLKANKFSLWCVAGPGPSHFVGYPKNVLLSDASYTLWDYGLTLGEYLEYEFLPNFSSPL